MTTHVIPKFKVVIIGDAGVGKTTFVKRHIQGNFERKYIPTIGVDVSKLTFYTTLGQVDIEIWDTAGMEQHGGLRDGYYIGANACIIMFDVTSKSTYRNVPNWYRDITRIAEGIPIVLIGNKVDVSVANRQVKPKQITFARKKMIQYYDMSAKSNYNYERPFLYLIRKLYIASGGTEPQKVVFTEAPALYPSDITVDPRILQESAMMLEQVANLPLPPDDEDDQ